MVVVDFVEAARILGAQLFVCAMLASCAYNAASNRKLGNIPRGLL
jgi:hypothetical protein